ncbi:Oidioi.mRNA.OKI2018_I69.XSR.g13909.t1.cds [Oikopleura dioica]|uniref:Oidioi.mRNA.OKI2018_I69.XSR.g13909.t1.cds n=1 Tax=Oikopleura dioica TaxID=34765 RepID=A0ABN7SDE0_OIKDI|nr:Oidioi.mRNA.OKI2018_I69.XSR.g13909.t1.cds [Oikopleura dioica]
METCNNKAKLKINRGNDFFMEGFNYIFNVSFTTSHKPVEAYDSQVLKFHRPSIGEELAPNIEIKCNSCQSNFHKRVSRTSMVHLTAQPLVINEEDVSCIMNSTSYKYKWTVHQSETEFENCKPASTPVNDDCEEVDINQETSTTGDSSQYLIIKQGILDDNRFYRFTLQIERGGVYRNAGTFILNPNKPPDGGSCEFITQNLGMNGDFRASQSKIEFRCNQWIADERDKPLSYVMRYATLSESPEQCPKRCSTVNPNDVNAGIPTCGLDGNILYKAKGAKLFTFFNNLTDVSRSSQNENIFSYLPLGCQMVCIGIRGETGALKVAEQCEYVAVKEPDNWQLRGIQGLSNLIDQKADPALIFAFAGSFVSILNSKMPPAAPISDASLIPEIPLTPETRLRIRLYVMEITSSTENDYHKQNETLTLAAEDILGGMGHVLEVITNDAVDGSNDRLFKIITQLNDVMYALGRWEVANATPWKLENIKQSKLSIFQSRHFAESLGSECLRALRPINCMSRFNLGFTDIVLPDIPRSAYSDSITTSSELLVTFMTFNPEKIMELDTGTGKKAFDTSLVSFKLWKFANIMVSQSASNDPSDSLREALMSEAIVPLRNLIKPIVIVMPRNKEPTARDIDLGLEPPMLNRHQSCTKTSTLPSATWIRLPPKCARSFLFRSYENAQYIDINIRLATNTTPYDVDKNGVYLTSNGNRRKVEVNCDEEGFCDFENYNVNNDPGVPISQISIENMFETTLVDVKVKTYDIGCSYFNNTDNLWKKNGMAGGIQTSENANRINCTANHTTVFGGETISSPNTIDFDDIDLRPSKNKGAIAMIAGFIGAFAVAAVICRYLDLNDLKYSSTIPHCGPDGPFDYEITIKTGVGWGSGTTANVGIRLYGDQAKSGSRQLGHSNRPFQRGSIEIYQISTLENLGNISKLKIWHDNTGLDPPWFLSRVIVKDLQTKERFYFLVDDWLQIDHNNRLSSVEKEVNHASPEEITLFEEVFRVHRQYQKADSHLWFSIVTRPTRSRYTRLMRLSVASASLFIFTLFTMVWYNLEYRDPKLNLYGFWFDASDIVTGIIASLLTFPISVVLAFLFKRSRSRHSYVHPSRPRTGIEIPLEIEIPNESRPIDLQRDFASSAFSELQSSKKSSEISGDFRKMQLRRGSKFTQESSLTVDASELNSDRSSTNVGSVKTVDSGISSEHLNLVSSRCSKKSLDIKEPMEKELSEDKMEMKPIPFYSADENSQMSSAINHWPVKEHFLDDEIITTDHSSNQCLFPHQTIHLAFFLCISIMILCSIFIYLYAAEFGPDLTNRWMLSLLICLITSLFILEPIKILFLAVIQSLRRVRKDPCESDNLVEHPTIDKYDVSSSRTFNVNPPQGFALEKARENARKLKRLKQLRTYALTQLIFFIVLCISIANETVGDRLIANNISKSEILEPSFEFPNVAIKEDDILRQLNYACDKIERKTNVSKPLGGFYTIRKPAREQPSTCLNGIFFGQKIEKTCGFLEEYTNAAICEGEDWVNYLRQSQEIVLLKNTVVLSIGAVSSSAVVVSRVEGQAIYKAHVTSYSAYVKSWKAGVKLSLFLQLILLVHGLYLLLKLVRKIRNSGLHVFSLKAGNLVLLVSLQITSTIVYITKEILLEESLAIFKDDENATGFYAALQINYIFVVIQSIQLFIVLLSVLSGLRFKRGWHCTNKFVKIFIKSMVIPFLFLLMLMFFFTTAVITVRSWNSSLFDSYTDGFMYMTSLLLRTTERTSGKTEERQSMISFVLMVFFYILGPIIFRGIAKSKGKEQIHDLKFSMARHENFEPQDHELVPFAKKRMRMWLGLQKQKKIRHHVRFEGMITPLSRGSSFCEDFDPVLPENEEMRASPELDEMDDPFFSDSVSAMTKISDASEWTTSRIIEENHSSTGPIEPLHMDYILSKLLNDSIPRLEQQLDQFIDETASLEKLDEILYQLNDKEGSLSSFLTTNSDKPQPTKPEHDQLPSRTKSDPNMKITKRHSKNVFPGMRQTKARAVWGDESNRRPSKITKKD